MSPQPTPGRCPAAHPEDPTGCDGPADAVTIHDRHGAMVTGCVHHGARLLASLDGGQVHPGTVPGAALDAYCRATVLPPFCWLREAQ
ncbi:hypothetical protein LO771_13825 [Streptacidiphilus sp. ASG 303]|uniref:hypothetical protein n=1 Tax=Streptacidiphilus sp. ASG 303 TaxID=2896847 RepID=UPI001E4BE9C5|nr:hypothetical protein [Streptacidiphilus sp. ASG 303]MCD0483451.1 hypothetical protein [Streptacidiphilus sp. ASG 303]